MSGHGKEVIGKREYSRVYTCIDCGGETEVRHIDWGAGNGKDSPLCKDCYFKRRGV